MISLISIKQKQYIFTMQNKTHHSKVDKLIQSAMKLNNASLQTWKSLRKEIIELGGYLPPYPPERRNRFWEHGLNPITGTAPILDSATRMADDKTKYIEIL
jgi:hypothetical protein